MIEQYEFRPLGRLSLIAIVCVATNAALELMFATTQWLGGDPASNVGAGFLAILTFVSMVICMVVVGRWIFRASVNAHASGSPMSISPGWAVGWFFIPVMNLFKPFHAMRETWDACHESRAHFAAKAPPLLSAWWTLWIIKGALGWVSLRYGQIGFGVALDLIDSMVGLALAAALIMIIREVTECQETSDVGAVFA